MARRAACLPRLLRYAPDPIIAVLQSNGAAPRSFRTAQCEALDRLQQLAPQLADRPCLTTTSARGETWPWHAR